MKISHMSLYYARSLMRGLPKSNQTQLGKVTHRSSTLISFNNILVASLTQQPVLQGMRKAGEKDLCYNGEQSTQQKHFL
jgi:hypothetical protein